MKAYYSGENMINKYFEQYFWFAFILLAMASCERELDPSIAVAGKDTIVFDTNAIELYANSPENGKGTWSVIEGYNAAFSDSSDPKTLFTGMANQSYHLRWAIASDKGVSNDDIHITFIMATAYAGRDSVIIDTNAVKLWALPPGEGKGEWSVVEGGTGCSIDVPTDPNSLFTVKKDTVYTLQWTVTQDESEKSSRVNIAFEKTIADAGKDTTIYDYSSCVLNANKPVHGIGLWSVVSGNGTITEIDNPHAAFQGELDSVYVLRWTIINAFGRTSDEMRVIFISSGSPPIAYAGSDQTIFNSDTVRLNANNPPPNGSGVWTIREGTGGSLENPNDPKTLFYGEIDQAYVLRWTLTNVYGFDFDDVAIEFKSAPFSCGDNLYDSRDGKSYKTVQIGNQCWMAENLNVGSRINGGEAQTDNGTIEKYCYNNNNSNCDTYGGLYQWNEMMDYSPSDDGNPGTTRGICPEGWHVPTDKEFKELEKFLGMSQAEADMENTWRGTPAGTKLKEGGSSGYEALLSGRVSSFGSYSVLGSYEYPWTATESGSNGWRRCLRSGDSNVGRWNTFPKSYGFSVRCVKN